MRFVAMTGRALQFAEERCLPCTPASAYVDTVRLLSTNDEIIRKSLALTQEIEAFIVDNYAPARFEGPGFLTEQAYYLQYRLDCVATFVYIMLEVIRVSDTSTVTIFLDSVSKSSNRDLDGEGEPWLCAVETLKSRAPSLGVEIRETLDSTGGERVSPIPILGHYPRGRRWFSLCKRLQLQTERKLLELVDRVPTRHPDNFDSRDISGLKLLLVDGGYDWYPVRRFLSQVSGVDCFQINYAPANGPNWMLSMGSVLMHIGRSTNCEIDIERFERDLAEESEVSRLFDEWLGLHRGVKLSVLGINMLPSLIGWLRHVTAVSPALLRHSDLVTERALDITQPHVVGFPAIFHLATKRFAYQCRRRDIKVVCYQHGMGTKISNYTKNELCDSAHADYFLTYGTASKPRSKPHMPIRATYVPVGSARIEAMEPNRFVDRLEQKVRRKLRVLLIPEVPENPRFGIVGNGRPAYTTTYWLAIRCLEILGQSDSFNVTYRPLQTYAKEDGIVRWLVNASNPSLQIDAYTPMEMLMRTSDVVVILTSQPTTWAEAIALGKPCILFCDPYRSYMYANAIPDLEKACHWCKSEHEFLTAILELSDGGRNFVRGIQNNSHTQEFLKKYVLHHRDCVKRSVSFLSSVCKNGMAVEEWERSMTADD